MINYNENENGNGKIDHTNKTYIDQDLEKYRRNSVSR